MRWIVAFSLLVAAPALAQDKIGFAGSHPPDPAVLKLVQEYRQAAAGWTSVAERDAKRAALVSDGYFYHGLDGKPIGFKGLTNRQTANELKITQSAISDIVLHQFENTAVVTYRTSVKGEDKGKPFERDDSAAVIMSRTPAGWKVVADMVGH